MSTTKLYTAEDLLRMQDSAWHELIEGELVDVSPSSGRSSAIGVRIARLLGDFVDEQRLGYVTGEHGGYLLRSNPDTVIAPDVGFVQRAWYPDDLPEQGYLGVRPDLAVEVISPSDEPGDMWRKQQLYEQAGVPLVWWVDPKTRSVTVRQAGAEPVILTEGDELDGGEMLPGFRLVVFAIFVL
jgi:Uma2 family endonuclease